MADNLVFLNRYDDSPTGNYEGPWQMLARDIDPSLLVEETHDNEWTDHPVTWWSSQSVKLPRLSRDAQAEWLDDDAQQLNDVSLIDVADQLSNEKWLVLSGFRQFGTLSSAGPTIDSWCRIWCVLVEKRHRNRFLNAVRHKTLIDPSALPTAGTLRHAFLGEYPWHPACEVSKDWTTIDRDYGFAHKVLPTVVDFEAEQGGYDRSLKRSVRTFLPAPWIMSELDLRLADGRRIQYVDPSDRTLFKDPSVEEEGPSAALVDRESFVQLVSRRGLTAFWVIAGEKGAYGERLDDFVGRRVHSFVYTLNDSGVVIRVANHIRRE